MNAPIYIPLFRLRQEEKKVLISFEFESDIFPYVEIFKEFERLPPKPRPSKTTKLKKKREPKVFHEVYLPTLDSIKSERVFVDMPVHLKLSTKMKREVIEFLRGVAGKRDIRTDYMLQLSPLKDKVIPVISTYSQRTGEPNSIRAQEKDLRAVFKQLAFRTSEFTFVNDISQIEAVVTGDDFIFVDLEDHNPFEKEGRDILEDMLSYFKTFNKCNVVILGSPVHNLLKNSRLDHGMLIDTIDNSMMDKYEELGGNCFADYAGIKRDPVEDGGGISPGFLFYDAIGNEFYGFKGKDKPLLEDFETKIVPDVLSSTCAAMMKESNLEYLGPENKGWKIIENIWDRLESGKSQAKFKRISMEHYLHCLRTKIRAGYFLF